MRQGRREPPTEAQGQNAVPFLLDDNAPYIALVHQLFDLGKQLLTHDLEFLNAIAGLLLDVLAIRICLCHDAISPYDLFLKHNFPC